MDTVDSSSFRRSECDFLSTDRVGAAWGKPSRLGMNIRCTQAIPRSGGVHPRVIHRVSTGCPRGSDPFCGPPEPSCTGRPQVIHEWPTGSPQPIPMVIPMPCAGFFRAQWAANPRSVAVSADPQSFPQGVHDRQDPREVCLMRIVSSLTWLYIDRRSAMSERILRSACITVV